MAATPALDSLTVGDEVASVRHLVTRDSLVRYAGASGDFNPIHYRDDVAEFVGLPGVLAHGMLTMGIASQAVVDWVGDPARVVDYQVRFTRPVVVDRQDGATLDVTAKVAVIEADAGRARIDIVASVDGKTVLGKAQAWVSLI
ncbi:MaoC/PaaZ C-terminal domain-containing protein [Humibacter sp. RRB41]|uniref:MaoC/PaaZ C-terminal domain-containing protein n=1 Tax=Humibacter sp. RRB41 TaxID=2919946 RepID=UPI001FA954EB|nr:MaoC/PaaZ C-terminal domain-containing protein [Humibacter sp. RRB41]